MTAGSCPPIASVNAAEPPLYGTCVSGTFAWRASMTPRKCIAVPAPGVPYAAFEGSAFAKARYSCSVFAGIELPTAIPKLMPVALATGIRSFSESYLIDR
jgi:hypothetical protein